MHVTAEGQPPTPAADIDEELIEGFVTASRVLVAVAARSLAELDAEITLPQYRVLVVLAAHGDQRAVDLAETVGITAGTASRMIERLVRKRLVTRRRSREDRRNVRVQLTETGRDVVRTVSARRRSEIAAILRSVAPSRRAALTAALQAFAAAAGEIPDRDWALEL